MNTQPTNVDATTYFAAAYGQLVVTSLVMTLQEAGVLSREQIDAVFRRAASAAKQMADENEMPAAYRPIMQEVHEMLLKGTIAGGGE